MTLLDAAADKDGYAEIHDVGMRWCYYDFVRPLLGTVEGTEHVTRYVVFTDEGTKCEEVRCAINAGCSR